MDNMIFRGAESGGCFDITKRELVKHSLEESLIEDGIANYETPTVDAGETTTEEPDGGETTTEEPDGGETTTEEPDGGETTTEEPDGGDTTTDEP